MNLDRKLLREARMAGGAIALTILLGIAGGVLIVLQARRLSAVIARVFLQGQTLGQVAPLLYSLLAVMILRSLIVLAGEVSAGAVAVRVKNHLRGILFRKLFELGPAYTQGEHSGELAATAMQGVDALDAYFSQYLPQLVLAAAVPLIILATVFPLDLLSGVVLLVTAPLIPIFMILIGKAAEALTKRQYTALSRMSAFFLDTLQGLTTLKTLGQSQKQAARIEKVADLYRSATMTVLRVTFLSALTLELVGTLSTAVIAVEIGLRLLYGQVGFEQAFFILVIAPELYLPLRQLGLRFHAGMAGVTAARRIFEILETPPRSPSFSPKEMSVSRSIESISPWEKPEAESFTLAFENVHFTYPAREVEALAGVSFEIHSGEHVALMGWTGCGKSTVASLLLRFYTPDWGRITLNGQPADAIPVETWRKNIAWVPQRPHLFHATVAENLRIANPEATLEDLRQAAELALLDEFIQSLPQRYETMIGEQGARLSGGQAQRLALARAFLCNAPVLVIDEPSAHLDPELARSLENSIRCLQQNKTVLMIAHSLPTVQQADRILVMEAGRVVEAGTHADLSGRQSLYTRLLQAYGTGS